MLASKLQYSNESELQSCFITEYYQLDDSDLYTVVSSFFPHLISAVAHWKSTMKWNEISWNTYTPVGNIVVCQKFNQHAQQCAWQRDNNTYQPNITSYTQTYTAHTRTENISYIFIY